MSSKRFLMVPEVFVGGEQALARSDHGQSHFIEIGEIHRCLLQSQYCRRFPQDSRRFLQAKIDGSRAIPKKLWSNSGATLEEV